MDTKEYITKEIPVFLCKNLADKLFLFQFACKFRKTYSQKEIIASRVKVEHCAFELDYRINTKSEYYDSYLGEQFAENNETKEKSISVVSKVLDKITIRSQRGALKKDMGIYSICVVYQSQFCITPLTNTLTFLPLFDHMQRSKKIKNRNSLENGISDESEDEEVDVKPIVEINVKFSQKVGDQAKINHESNYQQYLSKVAEEPWCETMYYNNNCSKSLVIAEGLSKIIPRNRCTLLSLSENEYFNMILPT